MAEIVGFIRGPRHVVTRKPAGEKWCFKCRRKLPHERQLLSHERDDPFGDWYCPVLVMRCEGCGGDHTTFPGVEYEDAEDDE